MLLRGFQPGSKRDLYGGFGIYNERGMQQFPHEVDFEELSDEDYRKIWVPSFGEHCTRIIRTKSRAPHSK